MEQKIPKKGSKSPKKQRLARYTADLHQKGKFVSVNLSKELREKYKKRSLRVRKGDKIKIMRGSFKGKSNEVNRVDLKRERVYVEGTEVIKKDGTKVLKHFPPSNLMIISLNLTDKKRKAKLGGKND